MADTVPITITPTPPETPPAYLNCPLDPNADYFLKLIAPQYNEDSNRNGFLCLAYENTVEGDRFEYRVALRAAHYMTSFLLGGGQSGITVDPNSVKSYKEGDISITYRDNVAATDPKLAGNPYEKELLELEKDIVGTGIGVRIIL